LLRGDFIGDSARLNEADRGLLSGFPNAVSINVGSYSTTIGQTNPNVVQFVKEGVEGTYRILTLLDTSGSLPESSFKDFMSHPAREAHLGERSMGVSEKEEMEKKQEQWVLESL
jgi:hypothetical protein